MEIEETRGTAAVGPENKKDGLQKCLSQNHAHLLFDNKNPLGCSINQGSLLINTLVDAESRPSERDGAWLTAVQR